MRGVKKRCAHAFHPHDDFERRRFFTFVQSQIKTMPRLRSGLKYESLLDDWLAHSNYTAARAAELKKLASDYMNGDIDMNRIYLCDSFIKSEMYDEIKEARIINARTDWFKVIAGPYIHAIEKLVYDDHFVKHKTPAQIVKRLNKLRSVGSIFMETDYSSFEGSFDPELQRHVERALWDHMLVDYPEILSIIQRAYSRSHIRYKNRAHAIFEGSRMSGDMWTSLANGFTNKMINEYMAMCARDNEYDYLVEGDDAIICSSSRWDTDIPARLGFKLTLETASDFNELSFCGLNAVDGVLIPNVRKILTRYGYTAEMKYYMDVKTNNQRYRDLMYSKACSLLATSAKVPVLGELARQQMRVWNGVNNFRYYDWWERQFYSYDEPEPLQSQPISMSVRRFVEEKYHIPIVLQLQLEEEIRCCNFKVFDIEF